MADYMEENLDMPLGKILPIIQEAIMNPTMYFGVRTLKNPNELPRSKLRGILNGKERSKLRGI